VWDFGVLAGMGWVVFVIVGMYDQDTHPLVCESFILHAGRTFRGGRTFHDDRLTYC